MAKIDPPAHAWIELGSAEVCAKAARAMTNSKFDADSDPPKVRATTAIFQVSQGARHLTGKL